MNYYIRNSLALGVIGALVYAEAHEGNPHAEFVAASPTNNIIVSGGMVDNASTATVIYHPAPVALEDLVPHDRLSVQVNALTPPTQTVARSRYARTSNPFSERRPRARHLDIRSKDRPPFWCCSFQKFRARVVT